jgi:hypothetical protein
MRSTRLLLCIGSLLAGCGLFRSEGKSASEGEPEAGGAKRVMVEMPWETTKARDNVDAPVLTVVVLDDGRDGVAVPYLYGYPLYADGDAQHGILKLRHDNWEGSNREQQQDDHGITHVRETLPKLGCELLGIEESETQFVPIELRCALPPPRELGGSKRPVLGELHAGATPEQVVSEPSIRKAFYGEWHLQSESLAKGKGDGFFNTDHGQLAFGFDRGKLVSVAYYFDPPVKAWRDPALWAAP